MSESISQLPLATQANATDLIPATQGSIGPGTGTTRAVTQAQIIAAGGTVTSNITLDAGGGWSSNNVGKQLLVTTPAGVSNPGIGITDSNGVNLWGIFNASGVLELSRMPAYSDNVTGPINIVSVSSAGVAILGDVSAASLSGGPFAGLRNAIINGNFRVNQRAYVSGTATAAFAYMHDRWQAGSGGCTYTFSQTQPDTTVTITAGTLRQLVEGTNLPGGTMTLSWAGTAHAQINNVGGFLSSPITVTGLVAGSNVTLEWNTGTLGNAQFEFGSEATSFERRPITTEQLLCYRYFWVVPTEYVLGGFTEIGFGVAVSQTVQFPVLMRTSPTVTTTFSAGIGNASEVVNNVSVGGFLITLTATGAGTGFFQVVYNNGNTASAEL